MLMPFLGKNTQGHSEKLEENKSSELLQCEANQHISLLSELGVPEEHLGTNYYKPIGSQSGDDRTSCISTIWSSFCTDVYAPIELFFP
jgi:hypothetical protein